MGPARAEPRPPPFGAPKSGLRRSPCTHQRLQTTTSADDERGAVRPDPAREDAEAARQGRRPLPTRNPEAPKEEDTSKSRSKR
jgi:hypothetical protein